jgi:hypothetical protein
MDMKITSNEDNNIQFEYVYTPIVFKSGSGESISIVMRDSGFEFFYEGDWYSAKNGKIHKFPTKYDKNIIV